MDAEYRTLIPMFDELRGQRVVIRPYRVEDAEDLQGAVAESRDHIRPWLPFADAHQTVEDTRDWIIQQMAHWLLRENMNLALFEAKPEGGVGRFLGGTGLHPHRWDTRFFEIGYWLRRSAEGHGFMTEAVRLLTDFALNELKANRVLIRCDERNERSAAVARRLGYVLEGCLRNMERDHEGRLRNMLYFARVPGDPPMDA